MEKVWKVNRKLLWASWRTRGKTIINYEDVIGIMDSSTFLALEVKLPQWNCNGLKIVAWSPFSGANVQAEFRAELLID